MPQLLVNLDAATLYRAQDGRIGGKICLQEDTFFFPEVTWVDFPVPLLTSWMEGALAMIEGRHKEVTCLFLDGPFRAILSVESNSAWTVSFIEDRLYGPELLNRATFDSPSFLFSLLGCADVVSRLCSVNLWKSSYVDHLNAQRRLWHKHIIL
jgi:hypothetical protein